MSTFTQIIQSPNYLDCQMTIVNPGQQAQGRFGPEQTATLRDQIGNENPVTLSPGKFNSPLPTQADVNLTKDFAIKCVNGKFYGFMKKPKTEGGKKGYSDNTKGLALIAATLYMRDAQSIEPVMEVARQFEAFLKSNITPQEGQDGSIPF
jgi:hypothetical protein